MIDDIAGEYEEGKDEQRIKEKPSDLQKCWLCSGPLNSFNKKSGGLCSLHTEVPVYVIFTFSQRAGIRVELYPDHKELDRAEFEMVEGHTDYKEYTRRVQITIPRREFDKIWIFQRGVQEQRTDVNLFAPSGFLGYHFLDTFFVQIPSYILRILFEHPEMFEELKSLSEGVRLHRSICR